MTFLARCPLFFSICPVRARIRVARLSQVHRQSIEWVFNMQQWIYIIMLLAITCSLALKRDTWCGSWWCHGNLANQCKLEVTDFAGKDIVPVVNRWCHHNVFFLTLEQNNQNNILCPYNVETFVVKSSLHELIFLSCFLVLNCWFFLNVFAQITHYKYIAYFF